MGICENCKITHDGKYASGRFCSEKCSRGFSTKKSRKEINMKVSSSLSGRGHSDLIKICKKCFREFNIPYNKRKQVYCSIECKDLDQRIREKKICQVCKKKLTFNKRACSRECLSRDKDYKRLLSGNNRGGNCKWFDFIKKDGVLIKLQGTYELRFAKILDKLDSEWIKPTIWNREHQFEWTDSENITHWYTPDFWSPLFKKYFEIKGYWTENQKDKKKFIEKIDNVRIIYIEDLLKIEGNDISYFY